MRRDLKVSGTWMHGVRWCLIEHIFNTLDCKLARLNDSKFCFLFIIIFSYRSNIKHNNRWSVRCVFFISMYGFTFFKEVYLHNWFELKFIKKMFAISYRMESVHVFNISYQEICSHLKLYIGLKISDLFWKVWFEKPRILWQPNNVTVINSCEL